MSIEFRIAETASFQKLVKRKENRVLYEKIRRYIYPLLRENPFYGRNIKKLKGKWRAIYRYRVGSYRLFYRVDKENIIVFILDLSHRQGSYD